MPEKKIVQIVKELNQLIKQQFPDLRGLYLYGSMAKGKAHKNSDIDIIAIFDEVSREKTFEIAGILSDLEYKYNIYLDFHSYTTKDLERNPYYYNEVVNKGLFYEAA